MGGEQSECLIVPLKRGNRPKGPCGGKGASGHGTVGGTDDRDFEPDERLNRTATDSELAREPPKSFWIFLDQRVLDGVILRRVANP